MQEIESIKIMKKSMIVNFFIKSTSFNITTIYYIINKVAKVNK